MALPLKPPLLPQLARPAKKLPTGDGWAYEPKWDGFRALAFVDGADVYLQSRSGKPLRRYFPELVFPPGRYVLDGEIVCSTPKAARTSTRSASASTPPSRASSMLAERDADALHRVRPARLRRRVAARAPAERAPRPPGGASSPTPVELTPCTRGPRGGRAVAARRRGRDRQAAGRALPARRARRGWSKIKRVRTIDAVVMRLAPGQGGGHGRLADPRPPRRRRRPARRRPHLRLQGQGEARAPRQARALRDRRARHRATPAAGDNERELEWIDLRPELVVEVTFDHTSNDRIRHGTKLLRWRDDKDPQDCTVDQLYS